MSMDVGVLVIYIYNCYLISMLFNLKINWSGFEREGF